MKFNVSKKFYYSLGAVFVIFLIGFLTFVISPFAKNEIPSSFSESRAKAGNLSKNIVSLLSQANSNIHNIQNSNERSSKVLGRVLDSIKSTKDARSKAVNLAAELEKMAFAIPKISPNEAKQTAIVAISSEAAFINKLISYNEGIINLLSLLQKKYSSGGVSVKKINNVVDSINNDAEQINQFNKQYVDLMKKFDEYYKN